ncbi:MAG: phosphatase PAP2 family protein [Gemmatimonadota bacterium]
MTPLFVVVTQLGDAWFILVLLSTLYLWGGKVPGLERPIDRKSVAYVMALGIGAIGLTFALKLLLETSRPPGAAASTDPEWLSGVFLDLYREAASEDSYDVPSGHAVGAVAVYGGLAFAYGRSRKALAIAAGLVSVIAVSRVVIGVHSLSAVLIGVLLGASYLWLVTAITDGGREVARAFLVAGIMGLAALATGGFGHEAAAVLGLAGGGMLAWHLFGDRVPGGSEADRRVGLLVGVGLAGVGGSFAAIQSLASPIFSLALSALLVVALLGLPVLWSGIARPGSAS